MIELQWATIKELMSASYSAGCADQLYVSKEYYDTKHEAEIKILEEDAAETVEALKSLGNDIYDVFLVAKEKLSGERMATKSFSDIQAGAEKP